MTIACLIGSSFCWSHAWELSRGHYDREYGPLDPELIAQKVIALQNAAGLLLFAAVVSWLFAGLCALMRLSRLPGSRSGSPGHAAAVGAVIGGTLGGILAVPVSQYTPLFGSWVAALGTPWSMARLNLIGMHFAGLAVIGAIGVGALAALSKMANADGRRGRPGARRVGG